MEESPTGTPVVPPSALKWVLMVYAVLVSANATMAIVLGTDHNATKWTFIVLAALAPLIGVASPGLRK